MLFLDTGYHFSETLDTRDSRRRARCRSPSSTSCRARPSPSRTPSTAPRLHERDPDLCCCLRKVEPLARSLEGYEAWVTGVRAGEAPTRADTPLVGWDDKHGLVKVNPLAAWTYDDVVAYARPSTACRVNPLLADGYPSIGCEPCTRRVAPGEDPRAGRWAGFDKTECGLHT